MQTEKAMYESILLMKHYTTRPFSFSLNFDWGKIVPLHFLLEVTTIYSDDSEETESTWFFSQHLRPFWLAFDIHAAQSIQILTIFDHSIVDGLVISCIIILLMEEILHHLTFIKPCK